MSLTAAIMGIAVIALVYFFIRQKEQASDKRATASRPTRTGSASTFHAVSINFESTACSAAKSLDGKRFLSDAAPRVPLAECDVLDCQCRFEHYEDRRDREERRNSDQSGIAEESGEFKTEHRLAPRDRRDIEPPKKI